MRVIIVSAVLLCLGLISFGFFYMTGGTVAPDGQLHEAFALLPIGCMLTLLGIAGLGFSLIRKIFYATPKS